MEMVPCGRFTYSSDCKQPDIVTCDFKVQGNSGASSRWQVLPYCLTMSAIRLPVGILLNLAWRCNVVLRGLLQERYGVSSSRWQALSFNLQVGITLNLE